MNIKVPNRKSVIAVVMAAALGFGVNALTGISTVKQVTAAGSDTTPAASCTVPTGQGSGTDVTPTTPTEPTTPTTPPTVTETEETETNSGILNDVHIIRDVKVGDVNVLSNDLNNTNVKVDDVLNPVVNATTGVLSAVTKLIKGGSLV